MHNSGWVQSPGAKALEDPSQESRLQAYVTGVVGAFAKDPRVLAWDVWNEPSNTNGGAYGKIEPKDKQEHVLALLPKVFTWARSAHPTQPLTSGLWIGDWSSPEKLDPIGRVQLEQSDVISFHNYSWPEDFEQHVVWLEQYKRPVLCTEFMARPMGSTFDTILADRQKTQRRRHQLGTGRGKVANLPALGFVGEALRAAASSSLVP